MIISAPFQNSDPRLRMVGIVIGLGLLVLLAALWNVQVLHAAHYGNRDQAQSLRRIRIPSARGDIVDRNGVVLANNRRSFDIVMYLEQLNHPSKRQDVVRTVSETLAAINEALGTAVTLGDRDVRIHYEQRRPLPLTVMRDVSTNTVAAFVERVNELPGADLIVTPVRQYPHGSMAAHVLGYVGKPRGESDDVEGELERFYYYQPDTVGEQGIERACNKFLRGEPGGKTIRVGPRGGTVGEVGEKPAIRGNRVMLTLDARIQRLVEEALDNVALPAGKELRGAAAVLDPRTGEVLAMASRPAFDPNIFNPGVPAQIVNAVLNDNERGPMLNRAIGACYAPGSTFKTVTLLAGLHAGVITPHDTVVCQGELRIGNWPRPFSCWNKHGHGALDMMGAMRQSCEVWFYQRGMAVGVDRIAKMAMELGLGQPTGIDLGHDLAGLVPTPEWKRQHSGERWWDGDTAQMATGQSFLLVTPLQMANVAATFANGGTVLQPFVVKRIESPTGETLRETQPTIRRQLSASPQDIELVRQAMATAVQAGNGTGHRAAVKGLNVAGKTGTAEVDTPRGRIKRAWFIGFAPYEQPQVAVAVLIEDAESGGHTAGPVAAEILAGIFDKKAEGAAGDWGLYAD
jgi:penicillin-binding protein 2